MACSPVSEADVRRALAAKADFIVANQQTLSMKAARALLEGELQLESGELQAHRALVKQLVTELIESRGGGAEDEPAPKQVERPRHGEALPKERKAKPPRKANAGAASGGVYSKRVEKLRKICQAATIPVPPAIYKGKEDDVVRERLEQLLEKHDLHLGSSPSDIKRAKKALQQQRDMDGIDATNILEGRPRRGAAVAAVSNVRRYTAKAADSDDDDASDETPIKERASVRMPMAETSDEEDAGDGVASRKREVGTIEGEGGREEREEGSKCRKVNYEQSSEKGSDDNNCEDDGTGSEGNGERVGASGRQRAAVLMESSDEEGD